MKTISLIALSIIVLGCNININLQQNKCTLVQSTDYENKIEHPILGVIINPNYVKLFDNNLFQTTYETPSPDKCYLDLIKTNLIRTLPSISIINRVSIIEDSLELFLHTYAYGKNKYIDFNVPKKETMDSLYNDNKIDYLLIIENYSVYTDFVKSNELIHISPVKEDFIPPPLRKTDNPVLYNREIKNTAKLIILNCKNYKEILLGNVSIKKAVKGINKSDYIRCINDFANYIIKNSQFNKLEPPKSEEPIKNHFGPWYSY
jgi:hypothetical protein